MRAVNTRVYLPLEPAALDALAGPAGTITPTTGYAITTRLERAHPGADEEALEYAAFCAAAACAARERGDVHRRRVVGAADVDRQALADAADPQDPARVRLGAAVPLRLIVSLHVDEFAGGQGELLWYDVTELHSVRDLLG